ncbi:MAG: tetratricopeptide repeat protein, partial [Nannocystaceae bacterium]|nr:tetratricopeptide repeat protein [Nannocystaceae bacterium]
LDQRQAGWSEMRAAACKTVPIDRATEQCLVLSARGIDAGIQWLSRVTPEHISELETLLEIVPDARDCLDSPPPAPADGSIRAVDIRHRILISRLQARSGKADAGLVAATAARHAAQDLGFDALVAEAALAEGESARLGGGDLASARLAYEDAYAVALQAGHTRVAAQAAAGVIRVSTELSADPGSWLTKASDALGDVGGLVAVDVGLARARGLAAVERWDDAIVAYEGVRKAVDASVQDVPPPMRLALYGGFADALLVKGRRDEASTQAEHALALAESALGSGHPSVASALTRLGTIALQRGQIQDAENRLRRALELTDGGAGASDGELDDLLLSLAIVVSAQGGHDEARSLLERAIALPSVDGSVAPLLGELCRVLMQQGELATARLRCQDAIAAHREHSAEDHVTMLRLEHQLGQVLLAQGELPAAEQRLSDGLARVEKHFGPGHPRAAPILIVLAELRQKQARPDDAVALLDRVAALSSTLGAADHDVVTAVARRAWLLIEAGRAQEVLAVIRSQHSAAGDALAPIDRFELAFAEAGALWGASEQQDALATANRARQDYGRSDRARPEALARIDRWLADR